MAKGERQSPIALYSHAEHHVCELQLNGYKNRAALTACNMASTGTYVKQSIVIVLLVFSKLQHRMTHQSSNLGDLIECCDCGVGKRFVG